MLKMPQLYNKSIFFFTHFQKTAIRCKLAIRLPSNLANIKKHIRHILVPILVLILAKLAVINDFSQKMIPG